jgi:hypothetical protein
MTLSIGLFCPNQSERKHKKIANKVKAQFNGKSQKTKWKEQKPKNGVKDQCNQGDWPTDDKEDNPNQESEHAGLFSVPFQNVFQEVK